MKGVTVDCNCMCHILPALPVMRWNLKVLGLDGEMGLVGMGSLHARMG